MKTQNEVIISDFENLPEVITHKIQFQTGKNRMTQSKSNQPLIGLIMQNLVE